MKLGGAHLISITALASIVLMVVAPAIGGVKGNNRANVSAADFDASVEAIPNCKEVVYKQAGKYICKLINFYRNHQNEDKISNIEVESITGRAYSEWSSIEYSEISNDGKWVAYVTSSRNAGRTLIANSISSGREWQVPLQIDRRHSFDELSSMPNGLFQITGDSRYVVFQIEQGLGIGQGVGNNNTKNAVAILDMSNGVLEVGPSVEHLSPPKVSGNYLAYLRDGQSVGDFAEPSAEMELTLINLSTGVELVIADTLKFAFDASGQYLAYTAKSASEKNQRLYLIQLPSGRKQQLFSGERIESLLFDGHGLKLAFSASGYGAEAGLGHSVFYVELSSGRVVDAISSNNLNEEFYVSDNAELQFLRGGEVLYFRLSENGDDKSTLKDVERTKNVELWKWNAPLLPPQQRLRMKHYAAGAHVGVFDTNSHELSIVRGDEFSDIILSGDARQAIILNHSPYKYMETWGEIGLDMYVEDVAFGNRRLLREGLRTGEWNKCPAMLSPAGKYILYFDDRRWLSYDIARDKLIDLTGDLLPSVRFDRKDVSLRIPTAVGVAGWLENDRRVLVYDRFDVWEIDPAGSVPPRSITGTINEDKQRIFRIWPHDWQYSGGGSCRRGTEGGLIEDGEPLLLTAFNMTNMASGFWTVDIAGTNPKKLVMLDKRIRLLSKAGASNKYLATQETFEEFPDLWVGGKLDSLVRVSNVNPQQRNYAWGDVELLEWMDGRGSIRRGLLYKPSGFRKKKYPVIIHVYGAFSSRLHYYHPPKVSASGWLVSPMTWLSQGYVVFMPDTSGSMRPYDDRSGALMSVLPGVQVLIDRGIVDTDRIGLMAHSWGGHQAAYMLAHTDIFRCAVVTAAKWDAISDYGSIRPATGDPLSYGADARMGSPWDNLFLYLDNSPVLYADRIETPLLIMHNEGDRVVPFNQSAAMLVALRRNRKEAYLVNYNEEGHELQKIDNQFDWEGRVADFFGQCLRGNPRPDWMQ